MRAALHEFLHSQTAAGLTLMGTAALAIVAANSGLAPTYAAFTNAPAFGHNLTYWVNDALMAIFFLLVGLEIKDELLKGNLATWPQRALPGIAALGGMAVPALVYAYINWGLPSLHGWAIPTATDIAFALGILSLVRVPISLKVFLTALAILDDLGAILVIALFYTEGIALEYLTCAAILVAALSLLNHSRVLTLWPYLLVAPLLWLCVYKSGLHATLAGVVLALCIPVKCGPRLQHRLHPFVAFAILPLFAFCNAGVSLAGISLEAFTHPVTLGIFLGLLVGKQLGVGGAMLLAIKVFKIPRPEGATNLQLYATTLLCAIGFTMSLFIGNLGLPQELQAEVRLGILAASSIAAFMAYTLLTLCQKRD